RTAAGRCDRRGACDRRGERQRQPHDGALDRRDRRGRHLGRGAHPQCAVAGSRAGRRGEPMMYLDAAATSAVRREVLEAMWPYLTGDFGNPSSHHAVGESAARALASARATVAEWLGCRASEVVFTSGGTEADNLAVKGIALGAPRGRHLVTTATEHEAVLESVDHLRRVHGFEVDLAPLDEHGRLTVDVLRSVLRPDTTLVTVAYANNEIGTVQPIAALAEAAHEVGARFHTDAVQAAGRLSLNVRDLGVDALS